MTRSSFEQDIEDSNEAASKSPASVSYMLLMSGQNAEIALG